jgi:hypothetical protein
MWRKSLRTQSSPHGANVHELELCWHHLLAQLRLDLDPEVVERGVVRDFDAADDHGGVVQHQLERAHVRVQRGLQHGQLLQ